MRLHLVTADTRVALADFQFVKHFDGLIGGAERALDEEVGGGVRSAARVLESDMLLKSKIVQVPKASGLGSRNLLVLSLGKLEHFTLGDMERAISHSVKEVLEQGARSVATPVIGISDHVGLPIGRAYRALLHALISTLRSYGSEVGSSPSISDVTVFDSDHAKVSYFTELTAGILAELNVGFKQLATNQFDIQVEVLARSPNAGRLASQTTASQFTRQQRYDGGSTSEPALVKLLYLAANPTDTRTLRLDEEIREIDTAFIHSQYRAQFDIRQHWAVHVVDLQRCLLRHQPHIVHFSGHGNVASRIILEDAKGESHPVSPRALSELFSVLKDNIRCVVLNACYTEPQAQAIAEHIDCVVGMSSVIGDRAAISFAAAFYLALGYGRDVRAAFKLGCVEIDLENLNEQHVPKLLARRADPSTVRFVG